jgi:hypothetical protein
LWQALDDSLNSLTVQARGFLNPMASQTVHDPQISPPRNAHLISVNQLKNWGRCQKKYYFDSVEKLRWPSDGSNFVLGQGVHKLLDYQSRGLDCSLLLKDALPSIQKSWQTVIQSDIVHFPIVANEWGFNIPILQSPRHNAWLAGRVDRISRQDQQILVIDWKTGTGVPFEPASAWQTIVYLYAVYEARLQLGLPASLPPEQLSFVYVEVKEQVREIVLPYSQEQHEETRQRLRQTIEAMLDTQTFQLPRRCPDRYCPYLNICGIKD